jgi:hypothetical protein
MRQILLAGIWRPQGEIVSLARRSWWGGNRYETPSISDSRERQTRWPVLIANRELSSEMASAGLPDQDIAPNARIEIRLSRIQQLFNSLDPSPFINRDLDDDAEAYIVDSLSELPQREAIELVIYLPRAEIAHQSPDELATAIHSYFAYRQTVTRHKLRALLRRGRISLMIGVLFLGVCYFLSRIIGLAGWPYIEAPLQQGLLIIGWVANWRPLEIFLYDWWPLSREARHYALLSGIPVRVLAD